MSDHPPSYLLEQLAAGEHDEETARHVAQCDACRAYVERLREAAAEFAKHEPTADEFANQVAAKTRSTSTSIRVVGGALALVAAAALIFFILRPASEPAGPLAMNSAVETSAPAPVRFKGAPQLAVIRLREGGQERLSAEAGVRPWDRLRVEVSVDALGQIEVGVLSEQNEWVTLLPATMLEPGTHLTPQAVRFDGAPSAGWIIAGPPEAVAQARKTKIFEGVAIMPLHLETKR